MEAGCSLCKIFVFCVFEQYHVQESTLAYFLSMESTQFVMAGAPNMQAAKTSHSGWGARWLPFLPPTDTINHSASL